MRTGDDVDRAAVPAVAAARPAARDAFFAAEGKASTSSVSGLDVNVDFVYEQMRLLDWEDADDAAAGAVVLEPYASGYLREDGVVFTASRVQARQEPAATLADDDRAARDEVPVVRLHTETLGVRIAAVAGTALSFFMCHCES
jgi:hypothetical protein